MFAWYQGADICYSYLADVPTKDDARKDGSAFRGSRWFKRGWTLQELIAPRNLMFLSKGWTVLGSKEEFAELVNAITGISVDALSQKVPLYSFSVAQRLSWVARWETTRVEDRAYSLLGIFDINMPTLYGEGERAFQRLQEEILRRIPDQSIFAWGNASVYLGTQMLDFDNLNPPPDPTPLQLEHQSRQRFTVTAPLPPLSSKFPSLLSQSPDSFAESRRIEAVPLRQLFYHYPDLPSPDYNFTPLGIRMQVPLIPLSAFLPHAATRYMSEPSEMYLVILGCEHVDRPGYLLARVCRFPSLQSGIKFLWPGCITISSKKWGQHRTLRSTFQTELIALSAEALARSSALATVVAVYLSHPGRHSITLSDMDVRRHPHKMINLLLKRTHNGPAEPRSTSDSSNVVDSGEPVTVLSLRWPDRYHPSTHWLTVSRPAAQGAVDIQDTITVEYQHALENDGAQLTVVAHVHGMLHGHDAIPVTISWTDQTPWESCRTNATSQWVVLDNGEHSATVVLSLEFFTTNHYLIDARWTS
ncbi:hypothetical protein V8D89_006266 [Ganoderma adspersum]